MKQERIKILTMIEEGKITVDEASKLLEALNLGKSEKYEFNTSDFEEKISRFSQALDSVTRDLGEKMGTAYKNVEPKFKKATKTVLEKTASVLDDMSKSLNDSIKNMETEPQGGCCSNQQTNCCSDEECSNDQANCCADEACCTETQATNDAPCCCGCEDSDQDTTENKEN